MCQPRANANTLLRCVERVCVPRSVEFRRGRACDLIFYVMLLIARAPVGVVIYLEHTYCYIQNMPQWCGSVVDEI